MEITSPSISEISPECIGASKNHLFQTKINGSEAKIIVSPTGIIRSLEIQDKKVFELGVYRDAYHLNKDAIVQLGMQRFGMKEFLSSSYNAVAELFPDITKQRTDAMIEKFWHRQIHPHMIMPDAHLGWRVLLPMARGCRRSCPGCPEQNSFELLDKEQILEGITTLAEAFKETHAPYESRLTDGFFDISDLAFLYKQNVRFETIREHASKQLPHVQNYGGFFGTPTAVNMYKMDRPQLETICTSLSVAYVGVEAMEPINRIAFLKPDKRDEVVQLPSLLRELNPNLKVIAIMQVGYEGDGIYDKRKYYSAEEIIEGTAKLISDAKFDGVRISEHVTLPPRPGEKPSHFIGLRSNEIIVGNNNPKLRTQQMKAAVQKYGISDIDGKYNLTISQFPYDLAKKMENEQYGAAGMFTIL